MFIFLSQKEQNLMEVLPYDVYFHIVRYLPKKKDLKNCRLISTTFYHVCQKVYPIVVINGYKLFKSMMKKLCHPEEPICQGRLLDQLYQDGIKTWKSFSIESYQHTKSQDFFLKVLIHSVKVMLEYRTHIQTAFCILRKWNTKNVNLFHEIRRTLFELTDQIKLRHDKYYYLRQRTTERKFSFVLNPIDHIKMISGSNLRDGKLRTCSVLKHRKNFYFEVLSHKKVFLEIHYDKLKQIFDNHGTFVEDDIKLKNMIDSDKELRMLINNGWFYPSVDRVIDILFPIKFADINYNSKKILKQLSFSQKTFIKRFLCELQDEKTFVPFLHHFLKTSDNFETLNKKFKRLSKCFDQFKHNRDAIEILMQSLVLPLNEFTQIWGNQSRFTKKLKELGIFRNEINYFTSDIKLILVWKINQISHDDEHFEQICQLIFKDLPQNFNKLAKYPFKCAKRQLIPLINKLHTIEKIQTAHYNLKLYYLNFHTLKKLYKKRVIHCIKSLSSHKFIQRYQIYQNL